MTKALAAPLTLRDRILAALASGPLRTRVAL